MAGEPGKTAARLLEEGISGRGGDVLTIDLSQARVRHCLGCGGCTHKTPGRCVVKDDMQDFLPRIVASGLLVLATPIVFGQHHPALKQVVDRFGPLASPNFTMRQGELHHQMRYLRRPMLLGVGLYDNGADKQGEGFARLIERHAINLDLPAHAVAVAPWGRAAEALPAALELALRNLEVGA
jgi:multimeric flavodoxin WrbA